MSSISSQHAAVHSALSVGLQEDKERGAAWHLVGQACIKVLLNHIKHHPSGLVPDFMVLDPVTGQYQPAVGKVLESERDGHFGWNACRYNDVTPIYLCF
jgi:hypothetical protein